MSKNVSKPAYFEGGNRLVNTVTIIIKVLLFTSHFWLVYFRATGIRFHPRFFQAKTSIVCHWYRLSYSAYAKKKSDNSLSLHHWTIIISKDTYCSDGSTFVACQRSITICESRNVSNRNALNSNSFWWSCLPTESSDSMRRTGMVKITGFTWSSSSVDIRRL